MTLDNVQTNQEREAQYNELVDKSCRYWLPKLTKFTSLEQAESHTQFYIRLIVDAFLKGVDAKYRTFDLFTKPDHRFNLGVIETRVIKKDFEPQEVAVAQGLLNRFIDYVTNNLQWKSHQPMQEVLILPKVLPVVREKQMFNASLAHYYRSAIEFGLKFCATLDDHALLGLICLSTIFDSNLLHASSVKAVLKVKKSDFADLGDQKVRVYIDNGIVPGHFAQLHCITMVCLIERLRRSSIRDESTEKVFKSKDVQKCLKRFLNLFLKKSRSLPINLQLPMVLSQILEVAGAGYFMKRPAFFHPIMTQKMNYTPLSDEAKFRVLNGVATVKKPSPKVQSMEPKQTKPLLSVQRAAQLFQHESDIQENGEPGHLEKVSSFSGQLTVMKQILKTLESMTKNKALLFLNDRLAHPPQTVSLMSIWLVSWLQYLYSEERGQKINQHRLKANLKVGAIMRYFRGVYSLVLAVFDNIDVANLEEEDWIDLLQEVIDRSKDNEIGKHLGSFIHFLQWQHNVMALPLHELEGTDIASRVNANLLTPFEGYEILKFLLTPKTARDQVMPEHRIMACAFILGYFCGLRRNEAMGLRVLDIYGSPERPFMFVRSHKARGLKNQYSRRRLDLVDFVPKPYLEALMNWHKFRVNMKGEYLLNTFLTGMANDNDVINPVRDYCRQITGDETFVFHGLRHSFANVYMLRLMQVDKPEVGGWFGGAKLKYLDSHQDLDTLKQFYSRGQSINFVRKYFPTENQVMPRSTLLQLGELLGHKVPDTTCKSYLHLIYEMESTYFETTPQSVLEAAIDQFWVFPSDKPYQRTRFKKKLFGDSRYSKSIDEHKLIEQGVLQVLELKLEKFCGFETIDSVTLKDNKPAVSAFDLTNLAANPSILGLLYPIIQQLFVFRNPPLEVAKAFGLPFELIAKIQTNVLAVSELKTSKGSDRFNHPYTLRRGHALEKRLNQLMKQLSLGAFECADVASGLKLYLNHARKKALYRVRLVDERSFEDYFRLLKFMKLPNSKIRVRIHPSIYHEKSAAELETHWSKLFKEVSNSKANPLIAINARIACGNEFGNVELEPIEIDKTGKIVLLEHYQYAIYLLAIFNL